MESDSCGRVDEHGAGCHVSHDASSAGSGGGDRRLRHGELVRNGRDESVHGARAQALVNARRGGVDATVPLMTHVLLPVAKDLAADLGVAEEARQELHRTAPAADARNVRVLKHLQIARAALESPAGRAAFRIGSWALLAAFSCCPRRLGMRLLGLGGLGSCVRRAGARCGLDSLGLGASCLTLLPSFFG